MKQLLLSFKAWCLGAFALAAVLLASPALADTVFSSCTVTNSPVTNTMIWNPTVTTTPFLPYYLTISCLRSNTQNVMPYAPTLTVTTGQNSQGTTARLVGGNSYLKYAFYQDSAGQYSLDSSNAIDVPLTWTGLTGKGNATIYFKLDNGQSQGGTGPWSDTVTVQIDYPKLITY